MPRTEIITRKLYAYDELSDSAQETARGWIAETFWEWDHVRESVETDLAEIIGQDGLSAHELGTYPLTAVIVGTFSPSDVPTEPPFKDAPVMPEILRACESVTYSDDRYGMRASVTIPDDDQERTLDEWDAREYPYLAAARNYRDALEAFAMRIVAAESDYVSSDEYARETSEANGYEYLEEGRRPSYR